MPTQHFSLSRGATFLACALLAGCAFEENSLPAGYGQLGVELMGTPPSEITQMVVTVDRMLAHTARGGWLTLMSEPTTLDLLAPAAQARMLAVAHLPSGPITQLRLYFQEAAPLAATLAGGDPLELEIWDGVRSGVRIQGPFDLPSCRRVNLALQVDCASSVWNDADEDDDAWVLRPLIRVKTVGATVIPCEPEEPVGRARAFTAAPPGTRCSFDNECLSGACEAGACGFGGPSTPCNEGAQCASASCFRGECTAGNAAGAGAGCSKDSQCLSNACSRGKCEPGGSGASCSSAKDCVAGVFCVNSSCQSIQNGFK